MQRIPDGFVGMVEGDPNDTTGLHIRFFHEPRLNIRRTEAEGRQIYDNVEMVEIMTPDHELGGLDRNSKVVHKVDNAIRARFPRQYAAFKAEGEEWSGEGMPLSLWPPMTAAKVREMAALKVFTVEQLAKAGVPESERVWVEKAQEWLSSDVGALKARIAELEAMLQPSGAKNQPKKAA